MYLLFLDESGTPPKRDKASGRYLVIGGLIIPEGAWHGIANDFRKILQSYSITAELKWKFFGKSNKDPRNSLTHLSSEEKSALRSAIFKMLTSRRSVKIVACVTSIEAAYNRPTIVTQDDVYHLTYKGVTERFQYFLQDASRVTSQQQFGMVISDHRMSDDDKKLRKRHQELMDGREKFASEYTNIVETIFFSPSEASVGLQLVDLVAGAVHRSFEYGEHRFAEALRPAFRTSNTGAILGYGLVKMPKGNFVPPPRGDFL
jgi:Protein of unknown function (DUF3800)